MSGFRQTPLLVPAISMLGLWGCIEFNIDPIEKKPDSVERVKVTEVFLQAPLPKVDLLLVIDRTASMTQELGALVDAADLLGAELDAAGIGWQIGVVASEMANPQAGWLLGRPWVLTPAGGDPQAHLEELLAEPAAGAPEEAGIAAAIEALELSEGGGVNAGFRRFDAALHVVFVSDGDDDSDGWTAIDPVQAMLARLELEGDADRPARASAVVGDVPGGCTSPFGSAQAGTRYAALAEATGGQVASICSTNFAPIVEAVGEASIVLHESFELRDQPAGTTISVSIDGSPAQDWSFDSAIPAIVFDAPPPAGAEITVTYTVAVQTR